uniref:THAP-type domain-containing protein n=1 Tax=Fundulus heteroclitus TaxID=8078 RepID=A0A3Q2SNC1_FUNHE
MPMTCCAPGCTQRHSKSSDVCFFRLPKDEERQKKWIISMKRMQADNPNPLWEPSYHDRICSLHFISGKYNLILHWSLFYLNNYINKKLGYMLKSRCKRLFRNNILLVKMQKSSKKGPEQIAVAEKV